MVYEFISDIRHNDFRTQIMSVEDILIHCDSYQFSVATSLFRRPTIEQRSRIIETILLGIPQPPLYVDDTDMRWVVVDGTELVDAIASFCRLKMPLKSLYFKMDLYEGRNFDSLSPIEKNKILNTKIQVHVLNPGLSRQERFGVYACLRSRSGADTIRWCRKKLYTEEYRQIEALAQSIRKATGVFLPSSRLERTICDLIVGINYKSFIGSTERHNIDAAVNAIMEASNFECFLKEHERHIIQAFDLPLQSRYGLNPYNPVIHDLYFAVRFHKLKSNTAFDMPYWNFYEICREYEISRNMDNSLEAFCLNINLLMHTV